MPTDTPTFSQWRARPVFISSTFKDMQAERSYLQSHVFPRLEEKLRERRHQFEPIDLRMGVETAELGTVEAREALVLKVCLEEIQRSRPFLIVILGDRYGWVPPPERMENAVQEAGFDTEVKGKSVGIDNFRQRLASDMDAIMWVDPGSVTVRHNNTNRTIVLYGTDLSSFLRARDRAASEQKSYIDRTWSRGSGPVGLQESNG